MTAMILLSEWQRSQVEFWRKTQYEGYDVSNFGRIRSFWVKIANKGQGKGFRSELSETSVVITGNVDANGYRYLNLSRQHKAFPKVHRLAAQAFLPNPNSYPEINHKTGIKLDNRLDNIEWVSKLGNMRHAAAIGLRDDILPKGSEHYRAKITESDVLIIRQRFANGESASAISNDYPIGEFTVRCIAARKTWRHVK